MKKEVFLGGTCNNSDWRDVLIPMLDIDYFNPVVDDWTEECQKIEIIKRETCDICLYTITPEMMGVYSIAEVVDDANNRPEKTVFCLIKSWGNLTWQESSGEWKSLLAVKTMLENKYIPVATNLTELAAILNDF